MFRVADRDLEPWRNIGITREMLDQVKNSGSHYQIVNHKLYRGTECMFPARYIQCIYSSE